MIYSIAANYKQYIYCSSKLTNEQYMYIFTNKGIKGVCYTLKTNSKLA